MMFFLWLWMSVGATPPSVAPGYLNCRAVPGWEQAGAVREYTAENLYEYKDGGAEGYLVFSFARMQGVDCQSGGRTLAIDVSDMTDADSAYGIFSANREPKAAIARIGMGGQVLAQSAMFAKGRYFVEIVETDGNTTSDQSPALKEFAGKMEGLLEGRDMPPDALEWFPPENLTSVRLVPESVLGLRILKRGYVGKYEHGQAFLVMEESAESAADVMKKLRERFEGTTPVPIADEAFQVKAPYLDHLCVFWKGRFVAGYANLPDFAEGAYKAARLEERLPDRLK